ncbi:MAG: glycosyltransferase [Candidatus Omnitrophota bacterium]|jgi:processive 1,2-diacylglycerol beta-glucosyltransferase
MKIIIVHASAGSGHMKAAEALHSYFIAAHPGIDVQLVDILDKTNAPFKAAYSTGYNILVTCFPWLWSFFFCLTAAPGLRIIVRFLTFPLDFLNTFRFRHYLAGEKPDAVISTHFLSSRMVSFLKRRRRIASSLVTVVTDFGVHPFWVQGHTDAYIAASEHTRDDLAAQGVKRSLIQIFGIPTAGKFTRTIDKKNAREKHGIPPAEFSVLLITGSFGIGPLERIAESLSPAVQVLVVCARNRRLYRRLISRGLPNVRVFGFVDFVEDLMAAADLIITKPGGLTISETLSMELPPLFISAIYGQETENARFIAGERAGMVVPRISGIRDIVFDFKDHPEKLRGLKQNISRIRKPFASRDVCEYVLKLCSTRK